MKIIENILEYNQGPAGQYCVQITIERTVINHLNEFNQFRISEL